MIGRFPRDRPVRESRTPGNMRNQPHCDNGEGVELHPLPYPLREPQVLLAQSIKTVRFYQDKERPDEIKSYPGESKLVRKSSLESRKRLRARAGR